MPCDSLITNSISVQNLDRAMLKRALAARKIAYRESRGVIQVTIRGQQVTIYPDRIEERASRYERGDSDARLGALADELKVMTAMQSVDESAEESGFKVEWNLNEFGQNEFTLEREVF